MSPMPASLGRRLRPRLPSQPRARRFRNRALAAPPNPTILPRPGCARSPRSSSAPTAPPGRIPVACSDRRDRVLAPRMRTPNNRFDIDPKALDRRFPPRISASDSHTDRANATLRVAQRSSSRARCRSLDTALQLPAGTLLLGRLRPRQIPPFGRLARPRQLRLLTLLAPIPISAPSPPPPTPGGSPVGAATQIPHRLLVPLRLRYRDPLSMAVGRDSLLTPGTGLRVPKPLPLVPRNAVIDPLADHEVHVWVRWLTSRLRVPAWMAYTYAADWPSSWLPLDMWRVVDRHPWRSA